MGGATESASNSAPSVSGPGASRWASVASSNRRSSSETLCPEGLLGLVTNTMSGVCSLIAVAATAASSPKSSSRLATSHCVWVPSEIIGCIEYDGTNPMADPPPMDVWRELAPALTSL